MPGAYAFHPVADLFPLMDGEEFAEFAADIRDNGLREDIWLHDGQIIDGRNRLRACELHGVQPRFRNWDGKGSLVGFVLSHNLKRRHLSASQRAMAAAQALPMLEAEARQRQTSAQKCAKGAGKASEHAAALINQLRDLADNISHAEEVCPLAPTEESDIAAMDPAA